MALNMLYIQKNGSLLSNPTYIIFLIQQYSLFRQLISTFSASWINWMKLPLVSSKLKLVTWQTIIKQTMKQHAIYHAGRRWTMHVYLQILHCW